MRKTNFITTVLFTLFVSGTAVLHSETVKVESVEVDFGGGYTQNVYIVYNSSTKDAVIIDPGKTDPGIDEFISVKKLKIRKILNTHGHWDHIGGNSHYSTLYKVGVVASIHDRTRYNGKHLKNRPTRFIKKETKLNIDGLDITVIHTPGHTPGCLCYLINGVLISGDTLFFESLGRTSTDKADKQQTDGIKKRLLVLPDETEVFPGHGASTTIGHEKKNNEFLQ